MIGLPTETDDDIKGIASLVQRAYDRAKKAVPVEQRGNIRMSVSCALFVPKAQTPFQWDGQIAPEEALRRVSLLRRSVKYRAIDVHWHDPSTSFVEAVMSRGGRAAADLGGVGVASRRALRRMDRALQRSRRGAMPLEEVGLDPAGGGANILRHRLRHALGEHISTGVSTRFLAHEAQEAPRRRRRHAGLHLRALRRVRRVPGPGHRQPARAAAHRRRVERPPATGWRGRHGCGRGGRAGRKRGSPPPVRKPPRKGSSMAEQQTFRMRITFAKQGRLALLSPP